MNITATKNPIIIFASPRSGSTALGHHVASLYPELTYYNEPNFDVEEMKKFMNTHHKNNYILKLLGSSLNLYPSEIVAKIFSDEVFKIKITRKNVIDQIASHYVAAHRNLWDYKDVDEIICGNLASNNIEIELGKVRRSIECIKYDNNIISKIITDLEFYYEDFIEFKSPTKRTPLPANYSVVIETVKQLYSARIS
jgi:hypothetical protein